MSFLGHVYAGLRRWLSKEYLALTGGTMTGDIDMDGNKVKGLATPSDDEDASTKEYSDTHVAGLDVDITGLADGNTLVWNETNTKWVPGEGGGDSPPWKGAIIACWKNGDPHWVLNSMLHAPNHATPANIGTSVARCAFFKTDTSIIVNRIRWFGVGATSGIYHVAVYRVSDGARMFVVDDFNTAAQAWGSAAVSGVTIASGVLYLVAASVDTTGATAGVACHSGPTGRIGVLPTSWPGNLDIDAASPKVDAMGFCQFTVTSGALPSTLPSLAAQASWTGGMPAFFLDNDSAA